MRKITTGLRILGGALLILFTSGAGALAQAQPTVTTLLTFSVRNGAYPFGGLVYGSSGALYGATFGGGKYGYGVLFQLIQSAPEVWTPSILHHFKTPATEGANPYGGLLVGPNGELYGTTTRGGAYGWGAAFEFLPPAQPGGAWTEVLLYSFGGTASDGVFPYGGLVRDQNGTLYGTTVSGGAYGLGTLFALSQPEAGVWVETVLHSFAGSGDAANPYAALTMDADGTLYGTAPYGGVTGNGAVFALTPQPGGDWTESVLCSFPGGTGGANPYGGVLLGVSGGLYGATTEGGSTGAGAIYRCSQTKTGTWASAVLFNLPSYAASYGTLVSDAAGALYATTPGSHGNSANDGLIFKLTPPTEKGEPWVPSTLYGFPGSQGNGPRAGLTWGPDGALFGTTVGLGPTGTGTVFQLTF